MKIKTGKLTTIIIKENSITLAKDAITMTTNAKIKILSKTWGEPKKEVYEGDPLCGALDGYTAYVWEKGKTTIKYIIPVDDTFCSLRKYIDIYSTDKNLKILGIKIGMKQKKAEKILKDLGNAAPSCRYTNGKVSCIYYIINVE